MPETTIRERLDAAKCVFSADTDLTYRDALGLHHQSMVFLEHLSKLVGVPMGDVPVISVRRASLRLTVLWLLYLDEHEANGTRYAASHMDIHFLEWAEERLSSEKVVLSGKLPGLIKKALKHRRVAKVDGAGIGR